MAGTGLPIPKRERVLLQAPATVTPDARTAGAPWAALQKVGEAGLKLAENLHEAEQSAYLAESEGAWEQRALELIDKHRENPSGFKDEFGDFAGLTPGAGKESVLGQVPPPYAGAARAKLWKLMDQGVNATTKASLEASRKRTTDALTARGEQIGHRVLGFAQSGDMQELGTSLEEYDRLTDEQARFGMISPDRAEINKQTIRAQAQGETIIRSVTSMHRTEGPIRALEFLDGALGDGALANLSPEQRQGIRSRAAAAVSDLERRKTFEEHQQQQADAKLYAGRLIDIDRRIASGDFGQLDNEDAFRSGQIREDDYRRNATAIRKRDAAAAETTAAFDRFGISSPLAARAQQEARRAPPVPAGLVDRIVTVESSGDPNARPPIDPTTGRPRSTATGAGQFIEGTWLNLVRTRAPEIAAGKSEAEILALRTDPQLSRRMVEAYAQDNARFLEKRGVTVDDGSLYLAHHFGPAGAHDLITADPATPVRDLVSAKAYAANPHIHGKTAGQLREWAAGRMGATAATSATAAPSPSPATATSPAAAPTAMDAQAPPSPTTAPQLAAAAMAARPVLPDPKDPDTRKAATTVYETLARTLPANATPQDREAFDFALIDRMGFVPDPVAGRIRGALRLSAAKVTDQKTADAIAGRKVEAALYVRRMEERYPWARDVLEGEDRTLATLINMWTDAGADAPTAVARAEEAMFVPEPVRQERATAYSRMRQKTPDANRQWLATNPGDPAGLWNRVPITEDVATSFEELVKDRHGVTGDIEAARKVAWSELRKVYGVTEIGGRRFQRYAPEAVYQNARGTAWIGEQLSADLAAMGLPAELIGTERVRLIDDDITRRERAPSYRVMVQDDNGVWNVPHGPDGRPILGEDGRPVRFRPDYNTSPAAERGRQAAAQASTDAAETVTGARTRRAAMVELQQRQPQRDAEAAGPLATLEAQRRDAGSDPAPTAPPLR